MPSRDNIQWFKRHFHKQIETAVENTPFDLDLLTALACQETGIVWGRLRRKPEFSVKAIVTLCVGDTLDAPDRSAFPKTKAALLRVRNGQEMFDIARQALVDMAKATRISGYLAAIRNPKKFAHGFGVWQYDLQHFRSADPQYFLQKTYEKLDESLAKAIDRLKWAQGRARLGGRKSLSDLEMAHVAIAYNTGGFNRRKGLKQGHRDAQGRYYGELIYEYLLRSRTVPTPGRAALIDPPEPGNAITPLPPQLSTSGASYVVDTRISTLNLRSEPKISRPSRKNVLADLPDGHPARALTSKISNGFREIETSLSGAYLRGFAHTDFLKSAPSRTAIPVIRPEAAAPKTGVVAVWMPRRPGVVTKRTAIANAHSLNEPNQPSRKGTTPEELVAEIDRIIDWLAVDKVSHKRYRKRGSSTFCNIYAHDFCHLAGVYLPRVWWTESALVDLAQGKRVEPKYAETIREMRANDLLRWLRDFGPQFGWTQTGTLDELQVHANQGGIGIVVARRRYEGRPGHITVVVVEDESVKARRSHQGRVTSPVQSQAGSINFRRRSDRPQWWKGQQFAESAFWMHS